MPGRCFSCLQYLDGTWILFDGNEEGTRLGIQGFFFSEKEGFVNSYCQLCWKKAILNSEIVKEEIRIREEQILELEGTLKAHRALIENAKHEYFGAKAEVEGKQNEITNKLKEIQVLNKRIQELCHNSDDLTVENRRLREHMELSMKKESKRNEIDKARSEEYESKILAMEESWRKLKKENEFLKLKIDKLNLLDKDKNEAFQLKNEKLALLDKEKDKDPNLSNPNLNMALDGVEALEKLEKVLKGADDEQYSILKGESMDFESIKDSIHNEIREIVTHVLKKKIDSLMRLCEKVIKNYDEQVNKLTESEKQMKKAMELSAGVFTQEDIDKASEPLRKRKEVEVAQCDKWKEFRRNIVQIQL